MAKRKKIKTKISSIIIASLFWSSKCAPVNGICLNRPVLVKSLTTSQSEKNLHSTIYFTPYNLQDKLIMSALTNRLEASLFFSINGHFSVNEHTLTLLQNRGGDGARLRKELLAYLLLLLVVNKFPDNFFVESFVNSVLKKPLDWSTIRPKHHFKKLGSNYVIKPDNISQQEFQKLTYLEKRHLPDPRDAKITTSKYENGLTVNYWQVKWKLPKHYDIFNIVLEGKKGSEEQVLQLRDLLVKHQQNADKWYTGDSAQYQVRPEEILKTVNVYDSKTGIIAVYLKKPNGEPGQFLTVCKLKAAEQKWLKYTNGNFVTETLLRENQWSVPKDFGDVRPNEENPTTSLDKNENLGFTKVNSFESDVMGITPSSQSDLNKP